MSVLELDLEHGVGEGFGDRALHLDHVLVRLVRRLATRQNFSRDKLTRGHRTREPKLYPKRSPLSTGPHPPDRQKTQWPSGSDASGEGGHACARPGLGGG